MFTATAAIFSILWSCIWTYPSPLKLPFVRNYANVFSKLNFQILMDHLVKFKEILGKNPLSIKKSYFQKGKGLITEFIA